MDAESADSGRTCLATHSLSALYEAGVEKTAEHFKLFEKVGELFSEAPSEIEAFAKTVPADLSYALRALVEVARRGDWSTVVPRKNPDPDIPEKVEELAANMIRQGSFPPVNWHPFIRSLDLTSVKKPKLSLLPKLLSLRS